MYDVILTDTQKGGYDMEITRTVNSGLRYYLDEDTIVNHESIIDTITRFNDMKIALYNAMYDMRFLQTGPLCDQTYSSWLKETYGTNDYYNCAIYAYANGALASQKELKKLYLKGMERDLAARDAKIKTVQEQLDKKLAVKASLKTYITEHHWIIPYRHCQISVSGKNVKLPGNKVILVDTYERRVEADIRRLKTRLALLKESRKRVASKKDAMKDHDPRRIVFGSKKRYRQKDSGKIDMTRWKRDFFNARHSSMSLPGRHTSKDCNFLAAMRGTDLIVKCMDGKETIFKDFHLPRYQDVFEDMLSASSAERRPVCYNFQILCDKDGRKYLIVSVTLILENRYCNESLEDGCIAIDLNYDHVAVSNLDKDGKRVGGIMFYFNPEAKTNGQISEDIGRMMAKVGRYCTDHKKPLVMEDLDTTISKNGLRYGLAKRNRHASIFAYRKMTACIENQSYKQSFDIIRIDPVYTSQMGKFLFMRKFGLSVHVAASYAIGLKGMERIDLLKPDQRLIDLLPKATKDKATNATEIKDIIPAWKKLTDTFRGIRPHFFYRQLPYEILDHKKRPSLASLATEMKTWDGRIRNY